jgi:hypothetical protein
VNEQYIKIFSDAESNYYSQTNYFTSYKQKTYVTFVGDVHESNSHCYTMISYSLKITSYASLNRVKVGKVIS